MTNNQKKQYLSQYINIKREIEILDDARGRLYCIPAQKINDMPSGSRQIGDRLADDICNVIVAEESYVRIEMEQLEIIKKEIFDTIRSLQDSTQRQLMYHRYIYGLKWEEICIKMNYDWSWVHKLHGKALGKIAM